MTSGGRDNSGGGAILKALVTLLCASLLALGARAEENAAPDSTPAEDGREIFNNVCGHCHGPDAVQARAKIDLRLLRQKYGNAMEDTYFKTVLEGRPSKGMPAWKDVFTPAQVDAVFAYLKTVQSE